MSGNKAQYDRDFKSFTHRTGLVRKVDAFPGAQVVNRDPCFKCGVRGDIGCEHQPAIAPSTIAETIR